MNNNGWSAGQVVPGASGEGFEAYIDVKTGGTTHWAAVAVYGADEKTAVGRRNFILRAIEDHVNKSGVFRTADIDEMAKSCGIMKVIGKHDQPDAAIATWNSLVDFGRAVISGARTQLAHLRKALREVIGAHPYEIISDDDIITAVKALKSGVRPNLDPTDAQVDEFITVFHAAAQSRGSYRDNIKVALKAALSK
jgi:hypothetical protein